ncbi:MAG: hypothetical protein Q9225_006241 [Loekoesia sp. 1 TL-2023]
MAASTAQILFLRLGDNAQISIYDDLYKSLHNQIASLCSTTEAKTLPAAQSLLSTQPFKAVLAVDGGIAIRRNNTLQRQLASYAKNGGTVIFCCLFSSFVRPPDMDKLWQNFEQSWKSGDYHRTTFYLSQKIKTVLGGQRAAGLEREYSAKALHLKDVPVASKVYVPLEQSRIESRVFAPEAVDNSQTSAAYHKYGDGWLGYIGDVNNEEGSQALLLAMLGRSFLSCAHYQRGLVEAYLAHQTMH